MIAQTCRCAMGLFRAGWLRPAHPSHGELDIFALRRIAEVAEIVNAKQGAEPAFHRIWLETHAFGIDIANDGGRRRWQRFEARLAAPSEECSEIAAVGPQRMFGISAIEAA